MIPMCIATPISKHPQLRSPKGLPRRFEGTSASLEPPRARDVRVSGRRLGRTAGPVTRRSGQGHNGDGANEGQTNNGKVASTWQDQGTLTVHRLRKTVTPYPLPPRTNSLRRQLRCTSPSTGEKAALGFAVGEFCFPKNEWRADRELCKRADTVAIEAASINSAYASASNLGVAMARWIKCAHQNC
jgi:hypothetical protein